MRLRYRDLTGEWMPLWIPADEEMAALMSAAGRVRIEERRAGPFRSRLFANPYGERQ